MAAAAIPSACRFVAYATCDAAASTIANVPNAPRRPKRRIKTKLVSCAPPTAPSVFQVNRRPTRFPNGRETFKCQAKFFLGAPRTAWFIGAQLRISSPCKTVGTATTATS